MTVGELRDKLNNANSDLEVVIYNDGNFVIEDAWMDRAGRPPCFAIQVIAEPEEREPGQRDEERKGSAQKRLEQDMKDAGRW